MLLSWVCSRCPSSSAWATWNHAGFGTSWKKAVRSPRGGKCEAAGLLRRQGQRRFTASAPSAPPRRDAGADVPEVSEPCPQRALPGLRAEVGPSAAAADLAFSIWSTAPSGVILALPSVLKGKWLSQSPVALAGRVCSLPGARGGSAQAGRAPRCPGSDGACPRAGTSALLQEKKG